MKVLVLDQSLKTTGWSLFQDNNLLKYNHFSIPSNKPIEERLSLFWDKLDKLYKEYNFQGLVLEDIQQQSNVETFKKLAYVQATILLWCHFKNISVENILAPTHWRHLLKEKYGVSFGRKRQEQKATAQKLIMDLYNKHPTEDECDSICIGLAYYINKGKTESAF